MYVSKMVRKLNFRRYLVNKHYFLLAIVMVTVGCASVKYVGELVEDEFDTHSPSFNFLSQKKIDQKVAEFEKEKVLIIDKFIVLFKFKKVDDTIAGTINKIVKGFVMPPVKYNYLKEDTEGNFGGVGVHINIQDGYLTVLAPMEDTPAFEAGVMSGDRFIKIDGENARNISMPEAMKKLRGKPGSKVAVTLFRPSSGKNIDVKLKRALIKVSTVKDINNQRKFYVDENKIGYIRITQFGEETARDLEEGIKQLEVQDMKGLVLDLRHNPGGLLDQAVKVCEKFLAQGELIVTTEGRRKSENSIHKSSEKTVWTSQFRHL